MAKSPALRQRESREQRKQWLIDRGAESVKFIAYRGTLQAINDLCEARGFTGKEATAELLTTLVHEAQKKEIVTCHKSEKAA